MQCFYVELRIWKGHNFVGKGTYCEGWWFEPWGAVSPYKSVEGLQLETVQRSSNTIVISRPYAPPLPPPTHTHPCNTMGRWICSKFRGLRLWKIQDNFRTTSKNLLIFRCRSLTFSVLFSLVNAILTSWMKHLSLLLFLFTKGKLSRLVALRFI